MRFTSLTSDSQLTDPLALEDYEMLWTLVDYSSMSDEARVVQSRSQDSDPWLDTNANWQDIFGVIDSLESMPHASHNWTTHAVDYEQLGTSHLFQST